MLIKGDRETMCQFHSFLLESRKGEILESVGEIHHSAIAQKLGVSGDNFIKPEFITNERRLLFDGSIQRLPELMKNAARSSELSDRDAGAGNFLGDAWQRSAAKDTTAFNSTVLRKLDSFLLKRFGTAEAFIDFVEPQWGVASEHARALLDTQVPIESAKPESLDFSITSLSVDSPFGKPTIIRLGAQGLIEGTGAFTREDCKVGLVVDQAGQKMQLDAAIEKLDVKQFGGDKASASIEFALPYDRIMHWFDTIDLSTLMFNATLVVNGHVGFDEFKALFKQARNRVQAWKVPAETLLV